MFLQNFINSNLFPFSLSLTKSSLISFSLQLVDVIIIFFPTVGYLDTIRIMINTQSPAAFNYNTCFILISAHGLKILYRIYHPYATRVFGQSVTQFSVAFLMAFLRYHYAENEEKPQHERLNALSSSSSNSSLISENKREFPSRGIGYYFNMAKTKTFTEFMTSFFLYTSIILTLFYFGYNFIDEKSAVDVVGIVANLIESTIVIPTFIKVVIHRDINNLSTVLILQFAFGDIMKLALFLISKAPGSFIAGACLQIALDVVLFTNYLKLYFCSKHEDNENPDGEELIARTSYDENSENMNSLSIEEEENENLISKENKLLDNSSNAIASDISTEL
ncbi:PQ-loop repeat-containing protein 1 [Tritrichomonas musculus]|uniref:PQ-loop repeat-containing protein 1 n=1 Tax=Tritrichomonas musculus TaxID=1915356 RepID=A0ABR2HEB6_9EUKA